MGKRLSVNVQTTVETTRKMTCHLGRAAMLEVLNKAGIKVPDSVSIQFVVPGGGNWSQVGIDIDDDNPVVVEWSEKKVEGN